MGSPQHILVVDDEAAVRQFTCRVLKEAGYAIASAADGAEALEALGRRSAEFDAVVSDIVMPKVNGVELMESLSVSHPTLPVILMSGYATAQLNREGIAAPCSVLNKPFPPERLLAEVRRCLDERPQERSATPA